jgi:NTP pyrophosphatase (non-canonical NTP hydrolase)
MTIQELEDRLADWHARKYGGSVDMAATVDKLREEVRELSDELHAMIYSGGNVGRMQVARNIAVECADVLFVMAHLCRGAGVSLADAVAYKLGVVGERLTNPAAGR